ncbi:hypothetical protein LTR78_009052 [Recurvomyces mirabilis]|uniref:Uncharacterized protein n=1 Tax=Recurvomyces mirabilis TaxID=574656 RepID=A0AAE0WFI4_9PEZI|nr:hypothetical protein LTR78_009052 [Recurvomyces mirabilis]KAK5150419.1 hypothetical protein LTS14_010109 [Recurvomyces mirabilis]
MSSFTIFARDAPSSTNHTIMTLIAVLLVLLIVMLCLVASLLFLRYRRRAARRQRAATKSLPSYSRDNEKRLSTASTASTSTSSHRRVMVRPNESVYVYQEKVAMLQPPSPTTEVPEIRITFPEEFDASGKRQSGRVVVVKVGETSIGLEPVMVAEQEKLPAYEMEGRWQSLDLERIGGLVEKARNAPAKF